MANKWVRSSFRSMDIPEDERKKIYHRTLKLIDESVLIRRDELYDNSVIRMSRILYPFPKHTNEQLMINWYGRSDYPREADMNINAWSKMKFSNGIRFVTFLFEPDDLLNANKCYNSILREKNL